MYRINTSGGAERLQDYGASSHPLLQLTEASILVPGPRCIGLLHIEDWHELLPTHNHKGSNHVKLKSHYYGMGMGMHATRGNEQGFVLPPLDACLQDVVKRVERTNDAIIKCCKTSVSGQQRSQILKAVASGSKSSGYGALSAAPKAIKREDVFKAMPEWFIERVKKLYPDLPNPLEIAFANCNTNWLAMKGPDFIPENDRKVFASFFKCEWSLCIYALLGVPFQVCLCACVCVCVCMRKGEQVCKTLTGKRCPIGRVPAFHMYLRAIASHLKADICASRVQGTKKKTLF